MSDGSRSSSNEPGPPAVKKRSLSNYLSNIQNRREELERAVKREEKAKSDTKSMPDTKVTGNDPGKDATAKEVTPKHSDDVGVKHTEREKGNERNENNLTKTSRRLNNADTSAELDTISEVAEKSSQKDHDKNQEDRTGNDGNRSLVTNYISSESKERAAQNELQILKSESLEEASEAEKNSQKKTNEVSSETKPAFKGSIVKSELIQLMEKPEGEELEKQDELVESELSEVDSDAPTEPASPPKPRLGRLIRGDQIKSPTMVNSHHFPLSNSEESELSDIEDLNHLPISSSILHGDSSPHKPSHIGLNSSPVNLVHSKPKPTTAVKSHVAISKTTKNRKPGIHRDAGGRTKLQIACDKGKYDVAKRLIQEGYNVNDQDNAGNSPLHEAALNGHLNIVQLLLHNGADVNIQSHEPVKDTPLIDAAANGHLKVVKLLLKYNADPTISNAKGLTAFESIDEDSDLDSEERELVRDLKHELRKAATKLGNNSGRQARSSSRNSRSESERSSSNVRMEEEFFWTDISSKAGREKLRRASREGKLSYVGAYLENGGRVDFKSFSEAVKSGHEDITSLFLAFGAQPNSILRDGLTPLMMSLGRGHIGTARLLLEAGADPLARDKKGKSVLSYAKDSELGLVSEDEIQLIENAISKKHHSNEEFWDSEDPGQHSTEKRQLYEEQRDTIRSSNQSPQGLPPISSKSTIPQKRAHPYETQSKTSAPDVKVPSPQTETSSRNPFNPDIYDGFAESRKPKRESSLSPGTVLPMSDPPRSQTTTPANSGTLKTAETAEEREQRLKAEELYRQKRLLNKKKKEQEFLQKIAEDERKREEEIARQAAERAKKLEEEKAKQAEKENQKRTEAELERRRRIRAQYPLGLRAINFSRKDDFEKFLPLYYVTINGLRHVLDLQICILFKDESFLAKCEKGKDVSSAQKEQIWNIFKFIFLHGGRKTTNQAFGGQPFPDIDNLPFKDLTELDNAEFQKFKNLPLRWISWDSVSFPEGTEIIKKAAESQMTEISLEQHTSWLGAQTISTRELHYNSHQSSLSTVTRQMPQEIDNDLPPRLRNRSSILKVLKGPCPTW
ncbi:LAQU0S13e00914g1_1 [Lachancea quebecensis]|uniref:LAQU0S13e00914g1_1 n=1 Tax=Lachancea quebecensis TaxID=1654605 RepID=A0A0P1KUR4_9SACH|nr:LAQU0S13e00914g1_1 [Lachancea quebecensis]